MMTLDWQLTFVAICVIWAMAVVVRRAISFVRRPAGGGCGTGGCDRCPTKPREGGLVQLGAPSHPAARS